VHIYKNRPTDQLHRSINVATNNAHILKNTDETKGLHCSATQNVTFIEGSTLQQLSDCHRFTDQQQFIHSLTSGWPLSGEKLCGAIWSVGSGAVSSTLMVGGYVIYHW